MFCIKKIFLSFASFLLVVPVAFSAETSALQCILHVAKPGKNCIESEDGIVRIGILGKLATVGGDSKAKTRILLQSKVFKISEYLPNFLETGRFPASDIPSEGPLTAKIEIDGKVQATCSSEVQVMECNELADQIGEKFLVFFKTVTVTDADMAKVQVQRP